MAYSLNWYTKETLVVSSNFAPNSVKDLIEVFFEWEQSIEARIMRVHVELKRQLFGPLILLGRHLLECNCLLWFFLVSLAALLHSHRLFNFLLRVHLLQMLHTKHVSGKLCLFAHGVEQCARLLIFRQQIEHVQFCQHLLNAHQQFEEGVVG